eukprot:6676829-Pyramimonas_sp.AAC.1
MQRSLHSGTCNRTGWCAILRAWGLNGTQPRNVHHSHTEHAQQPGAQIPYTRSILKSFAVSNGMARS